MAVINETILLYVNNESNETVWLGNNICLFIIIIIILYPHLINAGYIPGDGTPINVVLPVKIPLLIVYYALATIGIIFAFICLLFNLVFRNRK